MLGLAYSLWENSPKCMHGWVVFLRHLWRSPLRGAGARGAGGLTRHKVVSVRTHYRKFLSE